MHIAALLHSASLKPMDTSAKERAARRRARQGSWPVRVYRLGEEPVRDPLDRSTVEERLSAMWPLAKEAWAVAGRAIPDYERSAAPGTLLRGTR